MPEAQYYNASLSETRRDSQAIIRHAELVSASNHSQAEERLCHRAFADLRTDKSKTDTRSKEIADNFYEISAMTRYGQKPGSKNNGRKCAFTLAEVLITLGIIGVIAALTLPTLIANYQKQQTVVKLKQTFSIVAQALKMAEVDNDFIANWEFSPTKKEEFFEKYIKPYYNIEKIYKSGETPENFHHYSRKTREIKDGYASFINSNKIIISNGTMLSFDVFSSDGKTALTITVDLNGPKKTGGVFGKDTFMFYADSKNGLRPYGLNLVANNNDTDEDRSREQMLNGEDARSCINDGIFCTAVIMMDNWEISDDYPW